MNLSRSINRKISAFIILFAPVILLIYALVSYYIVFSYTGQNTNLVMQYYENETKNNLRSIVKSRAKAIDYLIKNSNISTKDSLNVLKKSLSVFNKNNVIFIKNGKVDYSTSKVNKEILKKIININSEYEDKNILAYASSVNRLGIKVLSYIDLSNSRHLIQTLKQEIDASNRDSIKNSLFWLAVVWFGLLFVSVIISLKVYNRLRDYEKTIQKNNEDIVFQSRQAMLGELLPMIAHQWRQPLNKIASVLMRMRFEISKGNPNPQTLDRSSQLIEDSVDLMSQTIEDFRTFYRPKEDLHEVELSVVIRKAIYFLDELLKKKKIKITHNLEMVKTVVHENELLQVLINLIKNASDAVEEHGSIDIDLKDLNNGYIEIKIEDDGTGIPEDKLEKIFEAHESSKQASMGLGLYMSKLIIENRFGGSIRAYNTTRGAGFLLMIPKKMGGVE